jgi:hypothetical protein
MNQPKMKTRLHRVRGFGTPLSEWDTPLLEWSLNYWENLALSIETTNKARRDATRFSEEARAELLSRKLRE